MFGHLDYVSTLQSELRESIDALYGYIAATLTTSQT